MRALPTVTAIVLALAVLFGGGTRQGYLGDVIVQVAACFLISLTLWKWSDSSYRPSLDWLGKVLLVVAVALCVVQLLPFFPVLAVRTLSIPEAAGGTLSISQSWWSRISLTPAATWAGLVSAIVPIAVFVAVARCDVAGRLQLWRVALVLGALSLMLGIVQMLQGPGSPFRFFAITNSTEAVGFFANRNHFAALLYVTLAFAGVWVAASGRQLAQQSQINGRAIALMGGAVAFLLLLTAGLAMARSRAGVLIAMGVVAGIGVMAMATRRKTETARVRRRGTRTILLALAFATLLAGQFGLQQVAGRFEADTADDLRVPLNWATFGEALRALPFGTGIGSFVRVYGAIEDPANLLPTFANRAHDDLAEFVLETGLLGATLIALFLIWFLRHAFAIWMAKAEGHDELHLNLQRAATLAIGALLLHALVDYGLRTTALSTLFAFACGLLTRPPPDEKGPQRAVPKAPRRKPASPSPHRAPSAPPTPAGAMPPPAWGGDIAWPDEWQPNKNGPNGPRRVGR